MKPLVVAALMLILWGCAPEHQMFDSKVTTTQDSPEFVPVKQKVFVPFCVRCHGQYSTEDGVLREIESILAAVKANRMPKGGLPLSPDDKDLLAGWASRAPQRPKPELTPDWDSVSANIFIPRCVICHNENGQAKFLPLNTRRAILTAREKYLNSDAPEESLLIQVLRDEDEPMPPKDSNIRSLNDEEIGVLIEWIRLGVP